MNTHTCIKPGCGMSYEDTDPDAYYCPGCNKQRKEIAAKIDATISSRPRRKTMSALQEYDSSPKIGGFIRASF